MSFGTSAGDIIRIVELARDMRKRFVDAPVQYKAISSDIKSISFLVEDIDDHLPLRELSPQLEKQLKGRRIDCESVLNALKDILDKSTELKAPHSSSNAGRLRVAWKRLRWDQKEVDEFRKRLQFIMGGLNLFYQEIVSDKVFKIAKQVQQINLREEDREAREQRKVILDFFPGLDQAAQHQDTFERRHENTGLWFLNSSEFAAFVQDSAKTLLCQGMPGAGKTIISSIVNDYLQKLHEEDLTVGVAYFYLSYDSREEQTIQAVLGSLIKQLLCGTANIPAQIQRTLDIHRTKQTRPSVEELCTYFVVAAESFSKVFVVLDALDEYLAADPTQSFTFLAEMTRLQKIAKFNLFATSRPNPQVALHLGNSIQTEIRAHNEDIERYIRTRMPELRKIEHKPELQEKTCEIILNLADGMSVYLDTLITQSLAYSVRFLLVRLHMDALREPVTLGSFKKCLENLPSRSQGLRETYDKAMSRIEWQGKEQAELAKSLLYWILYTTRALSIPELIEALAVEPDSLAFDEDMRPSVEDIDSLCAGLVAVDVKANVVRLVHKTTQEYFVDTNRFPEAHMEILNTCLAYMSYESFAEGHGGGCVVGTKAHKNKNEDPLKSEIHFPRTPFGFYAATEWYHHVFPQDSASERIFNFLLGPSKNLSTCLKVMLEHEHVTIYSCPPHESYHPGNSINILGIHLAAYHGLYWLLDTLIASGQAFGAVDNIGMTPIHWASISGHSDMVKHILALQQTEVPERVYCATSTPVNKSQLEESFEALVLAVNYERLEVVEELICLDGMEKTAQDATRTEFTYKGEYDDILRVATLTGNVDVLRLMLKHWGSWLLNAYSGAGIEAVDVALHFKDKSVARLLLSEAESCSGFYRRSVKTALDRPRNSCLVEMVAEIYFEDQCWEQHNQGLQLFVAAVDCILTEIIARLIPKVSSHPDLLYSQNGLYDAIMYPRQHMYRRDTESLDLLITNLTLDPHGDLLSYAIEGGYVDLVSRLVSTSAIDLKGEDGWALLLEAVESPSEPVIDYLISTFNLDLNAKDSNGLTPPMHHIRSHSNSILLLKKHKVDFNTRDKQGLTALSHAVIHNSAFHSVQTHTDFDVTAYPLYCLLEVPDIDTAIEDKDGHTALWWAVKVESHAVEMLLNKGNVIPDAKAIQRATEESHLKEGWSIYKAIQAKIASIQQAQD